MRAHDESRTGETIFGQDQADATGADVPFDLAPEAMSPDRPFDVPLSSHETTPVATIEPPARVAHPSVEITDIIAPIASTAIDSQPGTTDFAPIGPGQAGGPAAATAPLARIPVEARNQWRATPTPRPTTSRTRLRLGVVTVVGLLAVVTTVTLALGADDTDDSHPSLVSALTTSDRALAQPTVPPAPVVPGYQVVVAPANDAVYDVPAGWQVAPRGETAEYGTGRDRVEGKGRADDGKDYCPGSTRTVAFLTGLDDTGPATAATQLGQRTARAAYADTPAPALPRPLDSRDGARHGSYAETHGTIPGARPGCADRYTVYTYATPTESGSFVMVIAADTGVPHALDPDTARRILTSIRATNPS